MNWQQLPNVISVSRIVLVLPIGYLLGQREFGLALILIFIAGVSDGLDGYLAKRNGWESRLGSFLDPLADKLLLLCCFFMCVWIGLLPMWLFGVILIRDIVVATGAWFYHLWIEPFHGAPPFSSKLNTVLQIVFILALMLNQGLLPVPDIWLEYGLYIVAMTTAISGLEYVWVWGLKAWKISKERK